MTAKALKIDKLSHLRSERGPALVVRNGKGQERTLTLGAGAVKIQAPRVNDRRAEHHCSSRILPPYMRRSPRPVLPCARIAKRRGMRAPVLAVGHDDMLDAQGVKISMDGKGRWIDKVFIERLWRSVKYEEVYLKAYGSMAEARQGLGTYAAGIRISAGEHQMRSIGLNLPMR